MNDKPDIDRVCPFCGGHTDTPTNFRSIEVVLKYHPDNQFPYTIYDAKDGDNLVEIPSCFKNKQFFNSWNLKKGKKLKKKLYCEDL